MCKAIARVFVGSTLLLSILEFFGSISTQTVSITAAIVGGASQEVIYDQFVADYQHAVSKHGESEVKSVQDCLSVKGASVIMQHPLSKRVAKVCQVEAGKVGIEIDEENGDFVTAFIPKFKSMIDQVVEYLSQMQYQ